MKIRNEVKSLTKDHCLHTQAPYLHLFGSCFHLLRVLSNMFTCMKRLSRNITEFINLLNVVQGNVAQAQNKCEKW